MTPRQLTRRTAKYAGVKKTLDSNEMRAAIDEFVKACRNLEPIVNKVMDVMNQENITSNAFDTLHEVLSTARDDLSYIKERRIRSIQPVKSTKGFTALYDFAAKLQYWIKRLGGSTSVQKVSWPVLEKMERELRFSRAQEAQALEAYNGNMSLQEYGDLIAGFYGHPNLADVTAELDARTSDMMNGGTPFDELIRRGH